MYLKIKKLALYAILGLNFFIVPTAFADISALWTEDSIITTVEISGTTVRLNSNVCTEYNFSYDIPNPVTHHLDFDEPTPHVSWVTEETGFCNTYFDVSGFSNGLFYLIAGKSNGDYAFGLFEVVSGVPSEYVDFGTTRIISLDPSQASTTPSGNAVYIHARAFFAEESTFWDTININIWTRDENSVLSRLTFAYQTDLYTIYINQNATTTGLWTFSSTTPLSDGNYTIQFTLSNSTLGGLVPNPFGGDVQTVTHQFTVGTSTFIGQLNQTIGQEIEDILSGKTSTSTAVLLAHCKPWSNAGFDIVDCLSGLLIPDKGKMTELFQDFRAGIVYKFPWGYGFRFFALATASSSSTPPSLVFTVPDDVYFPESLRSKSVSLNPWNALSSTSPLTTSDGFGEGNLLDTVMPYWNIIVYGMVVFGVVHRILGHRHKDIHKPETT